MTAQRSGDPIFSRQVVRATSAVSVVRDALTMTAKGLLHEVQGIATHAALYPTGLLHAPLRPHVQASGDTFDLPVVMVHGYFHNRSGFYFMGRALRRRGFRWVDALNYNPIGTSIPALASKLAGHVEDVLATTGAPRVHLIGHSLGGLVARWYTQEGAGSELVDHCVTIGTPHRGTYAAFAGVGQSARDMRPGSPVLRRLEGGLRDCTVKLVNLYSDVDALIVPSSSAVLPWKANIHNHLIHEFGHTSMLVSAELIAVVTEHLAEAPVHAPLADVRPICVEPSIAEAAGSVE